MLNEFYAPHFVNHDPSNPDTKDFERCKKWVIACLRTFPDEVITIEDMVAEGEKVVCLWTSKGAFKNEYMGIPPAGQSMCITGMTEYSFKNGKVADCTWNCDVPRMLRQLGVMPG